MCSIEQRLEEIGRAIEELAVQARMPAGSEAAVAIEPDDDSSRVLARLAELWGLLADLDPEVARRLAGYQALLSPDAKSGRADQPCLRRPGLATRAGQRCGEPANSQQARASDHLPDALAC